MRPATSSAFEDIKIGQLAKSRCYSRQPHDLSAAGAKRRCWRALIRAFVGPGQSSSLEPEMSPDTLVRCPLSTESRRWKLATLRQRFVAMRQSRRMSSRRMSNGQSFAHQPRRSPRSPRSAPIKFFCKDRLRYERLEKSVERRQRNRDEDNRCYGTRALASEPS